MESLQSPLSRTAAKLLSSQGLAKDFAAKGEVARAGVRTLYRAILAAEPPAFQDWSILLRQALGHDPGEPSADIERLAACYGIAAGGLKPDVMLFALHTYYALVVKLLVSRIIAHYRGLPPPLEGLLRAEDSRRLRLEMEQIEAGVISGHTGLTGLASGDPFGWFTASCSEPIERLVRQLAARLAEYDLTTPPNQPADSGDLLGQFYQELFPPRLRHRLGEYYTPRWLANHVLEVAGYSGDPDRRLLDPACGSGTFLVEAIRRIRRGHANSGEGELCRKILANVVGYDLNPLAVITAKANYLLALGDLLPQADGVEIPVHLCDSILGGPRVASGTGVTPAAPQWHGCFDYVVGNPPWIAWDNLPADYREATKPLWRQYGLFSLSGNEARHGSAKKDLSMLMTYVSADRFLKHGGRLAMVVTQTLLQTKGAGDGFRRFRLGPEGEPLSVLRVDDMAALRPFPDAANLTATIVLEKGAPTQYPVPYFKWLPGSVGQAFQPDRLAVGLESPTYSGVGLERPTYRSDDRVVGLERQTYRAVRLESLTYGAGVAAVVRQTCQAEPIDPQNPGSPWFVRPEGLKAELAQLIGRADYVAHLGANSGGANGVYWVQVLGQTKGGVLVRNLAEKNKLHLPAVEQVVEPDLLYPLVRWADVARYRVMPSAHILLVQDVAARTGIDPAVMRREYPQTLAYLERFEPVLAGRAAYRKYQECKAFYSMYNVGTYTVAPIKVVWRRMDRRLSAAVAQQVDDRWLGPRPVIPQETCVLVETASTAEAHHICAVLNSSIVNFLVSSYSVCGGKGFGTPGMLDFIKLRRFDAGDPRHVELSACSRAAHLTVACGNEPVEIQRRIDQLAGELWGLGPRELRAIASQGVRG